jgi:hypothetical protein
MVGKIIAVENSRALHWNRREILYPPQRTQNYDAGGESTLLPQAVTERAPALILRLRRERSDPRSAPRLRQSFSAQARVCAG